jgi:hypothetical protein
MDMVEVLVIIRNLWDYKLNSKDIGRILGIVRSIWDLR